MVRSRCGSTVLNFIRHIAELWIHNHIKQCKGEEIGETINWPNSRHGRYWTQPKGMDIRVCVPLEERRHTQLLRWLSETERSEDLRLASDIAIGKMHQLARRRYDITSTGRKQQTLASLNCPWWSTQDSVYVSSRSFLFYTNVSWIEKRTEAFQRAMDVLLTKVK